MKQRKGCELRPRLGRIIRLEQLVSSGPLPILCVRNSPRLQLEAAIPQ